ncbi:MAG: hypothetical protein LBL71_04575 [Endomicrobium sp.]|jgi:hypothetical protein|nr:hypothetical protein [Endomicrobium sp.]
MERKMLVIALSMLFLISPSARALEWKFCYALNMPVWNDEFRWPWQQRPIINGDECNGKLFKSSVKCTRSEAAELSNIINQMKSFKEGVEESDAIAAMENGELSDDIGGNVVDAPVGGNMDYGDSGSFDNDLGNGDIAGNDDSKSGGMSIFKSLILTVSVSLGLLFAKEHGLLGWLGM